MSGAKPLVHSKQQRTREGNQMRSVRLILLMVIAGCCCIFAQSQANTGTIEGIVTDQTDRAVANAEVTLTNQGTNFTRVLHTDDVGRFRGLLLPLGAYRVTVKAP